MPLRARVSCFVRARYGDRTRQRIGLPLTSGTFLALALGLAIPAPTAVRERPRLADEPVIFSVVGDVPYDSLEIGVLQQHFDNHDLYSPAEFLVHVGDIKVNGGRCDEG